MLFNILLYPRGRHPAVDNASFAVRVALVLFAIFKAPNFLFKDLFAGFTERNNNSDERKAKGNGVLLPGGYSQDGEEFEAGGGDLLALWRRGKRCRHRDSYEGLLCSSSSENVAGHHLHLLWRPSQDLPPPPHSLPILAHISCVVATGCRLLARLNAESCFL
ncbi:hypothetical protein HPP92_017627 [Vanilla planifolia]|uniref:Uncharacterized protein n=1 Tax=Vanilla planifolia TaxID=51239 RepID=A0A835QL81_VANPL|nr:hypothetical protein HPP92_017627 [Vanilla planifolia]